MEPTLSSLGRDEPDLISGFKPPRVVVKWPRVGGCQETSEKPRKHGFNAHMLHPNPFSGVGWQGWVLSSSHFMPGILDLDNVSCRPRLLAGGSRGL